MATSLYAPTWLAVLLGLAASCSNVDAVSSQTSKSSPATVASPPSGSSAPGGQASDLQPPFIGDPHQDGTASELFVEDLSFGRLVEVFDFDSSTGNRRLIYSNVVVGPQITSDGFDYQFDENLAQQTTLTILHKHGTPAFATALASAEAARTPISDNGLLPSLPPWSMVARNAAISIRFSDLLDASTVRAKNIKLRTGYPPLEPFTGRVIADRNHGGLADPDGDHISSFYPTRAIIDLTVSPLEAIQSNPPIPINMLGLPEAVTNFAPNVALRMPTKTAPAIGQNTILRNASGNGLALVGNGTTDTTALTDDILRAFRSGGSEAGDAFNGMLPDHEAPRIVGELAMTLGGVIVEDPNVEDGYVIRNAVYDTPACASQLAAGDLIIQGALHSVVYDQGAQNGHLVQGMKVRVLYAPAGRPAAGAARVITAYDSANDDSSCFISYAPTAATPPNDGVPASSNATVRFSETIQLDQLNGFYGITVSDVSGAPDGEDLVAGYVTPSPDGVAGQFTPAVPFQHTTGVSETYYVRVGAAASMPLQDLAGNSLTNPIDDAEFHLDANEVGTGSGNLVFLFDSPDMVNSDGFHEFRGQFLYDTVNERLLPRPISRFESAADRSQPIPSAMTPFPFGVQAPLVALGSKLHQVWRYADFGFSLMDETNMNLDVEGLAWSPLAGQVVTDFYDEFSITMGHSKHVPDEEIDSQSGFPMWPNSGLGTLFADNYLAPGELVHSREKGYFVNPADMYTSQSGTALMPYPMNQGASVEDFSYYTWRDTAIESVGGANGNGVPLDREISVLGLGPDKDYAADEVPSIGLPLLVEFRCYPDQNALGLNAMDISLAANSSARPNFRTHSSGGFNTSGSPVIVNPDFADVATGGFSPTSNPPGQSTLPADNSSYIGSVDFVTTKSRAHTIWFDTQANSPAFSTPVQLHGLPAGTQIELAYRGADALVGGAPGQARHIGTDSNGIDPYGDPIDDPNAGMPQFTGGDSSWKSDIAAVDGSRYLQVRVSFTGNPVTNMTSTLKGLGFSWTH